MAEAEGIPPTASIASVGPSLRYIGGEHAYAFSGSFGASTASQTMLDFISGSGYVVGELIVNGQFNAGTGGGGLSIWTLTLNDEIVAVLGTDTHENDMPPQCFQRLIIPPFTAVKLAMVSFENTAAELLTATFNGRVYGAV